MIYVARIASQYQTVAVFCQDLLIRLNDISYNYTKC